jgi:hypothetical protein
MYEHGRLKYSYRVRRRICEHGRQEDCHKRSAKDGGPLRHGIKAVGAGSVMGEV